jgi:CMP-N-acetylneuraminic acid synthetase
LEELKHNTEQTVINTDSETLRKIARNTTKRVDACLREGAASAVKLSISSSSQIKTKKQLVCLVIPTSPKLTNTAEDRIAF